ncbi:N-acetylmuramoyl-L-alanine amidase CwlD [Kroppenstedtia eburnea]|uniref:N-acetylmuramoyl-L-alanine amidase n=1 Tax=Kroppenstedtia eburnea TaxID=714067 RepID=A0A1N7N1N8_9BACL|nr:N-acetylmuramoyl-L-alanine amidase CwlD [Kroppenstedtia eburnea]QKI80794.1 N-acetylmuramoyl-L-alanine amidase CwlD [Kroppenstedtia eburnea]SIS92323.1 N-acetylmuramoyl-L-alanine amidase [Kroppenstedtia eburnea]
MEKWGEWARNRKVRLGVGAALAAIFLWVAATYGIPGDLSRNVWSMPLSGKVIVLDPGHGGYDGGAVSRSGLQEKGVTLDISLLLRDYLQESGALVIMTREVDKDLAGTGYRRRKAADLMERARIVKTSGADAFISIHLNAIPSPRWSGAQTFYYPTLEANKKLAESIQSELIRNLENTNRKARYSGEIYILKTSPVPTALVEVGFLSNPAEAELLGDEAYQKKLAAAIYNGLLRYYSVEDSAKDKG